MLRVVADANVLISAALARSPNAPSVVILDAALHSRLELITSPLLLPVPAKLSSVMPKRKRSGNLAIFLSACVRSREYRVAGVRTQRDPNLPGHPRVTAGA
jgi:hypothetical protein